MCFSAARVATRLVVFLLGEDFLTVFLAVFLLAAIVHDTNTQSVFSSTNFGVANRSR